MGDIFSNLGLGFGVVFQLVQWTPAFLGGALDSDSRQHSAVSEDDLRR